MEHDNHNQVRPRFKKKESRAFYDMQSEQLFNQALSFIEKVWALYTARTQVRMWAGYGTISYQVWK